MRIRNSVDFVAGARLRALLAPAHYDVVHFHTSRAHAMAPYVRRSASTLVVTRRMDYAPNRLFAPWLYNRAVDGVAAISDAVADALARSGVTRERVTIIPSGVDCERFQPPAPNARQAARAALGLAPDDVAVGAVAMLEPRKGHRFLLEAVALARRRVEAAEPGGTLGAARLRCCIAGDGSQRDALAADARRLGLDDAVRFLGPVDDPFELLCALDIFVMPSLYEGLGVAALEAMACGLPVIASDTGGLREAVEDGRTGLLAPPGDVVALAHAIETLAEAPAMRAAMGAAARDRAIERFGMTAMARRTLEFYRVCMARTAAEKR
jgi:glycosyltransferase involved in cell wall biosynthesis